MRLCLVWFLLHITVYMYSQNFEGIIIYERVPDSGQNIMLETYYFGDNKIKIDKSRIDTAYNYSSALFDFASQMNKYLKSNNGSKSKLYTIDKSYIGSIDTTNLDTFKYLNYTCSEIYVHFIEGDFGSKIMERRLVAEELLFEVPTDWIMDYGMVITEEKRIALYLEGHVFSKHLPHLPPKGYTRKAIAVIPMKLPDSIFDVEN